MNLRVHLLWAVGICGSIQELGGLLCDRESSRRFRRARVAWARARGSVRCRHLLDLGRLDDTPAMSCSCAGQRDCSRGFACRGCICARERNSSFASSSRRLGSSRHGRHCSASLRMAAHSMSVPEPRDTAVSARILANGPDVSMLFASVRPLVPTGDDLTVLVSAAPALYSGRTFG